MKFHPQKCNVLSCTRSKKPFIFDYKLKGHILEYDNTTKYLGVDLTTDLSWNTHISRITKKANCMLGFLKRNLQTSNKQLKSNAYYTLVRPHLEYCSSIWNPHTLENRNLIEAVQRRAARYVCNRYERTDSVTQMLQELEWDPLDTRRTKTQLTMFYKILNNIVDIQPDLYLNKAYSRTRSNHSLKFQHFSSRTDTFKFSFFPRVVPIWNSLPSTAAEAPSLVSFKRELNKVEI